MFQMFKMIAEKKLSLCESCPTGFLWFLKLLLLNSGYNHVMCGNVFSCLFVVSSAPTSPNMKKKKKKKLVNLYHSNREEQTETVRSHRTDTEWRREIPTGGKKKKQKDSSRSAKTSKQTRDERAYQE